MSNVQPVVNPSKNKDTTKSPNNTPMAKDDTLPNSSFFKFCEFCLNQYEGDESIYHISGCNFFPNSKSDRSSYYFTSIVNIWGWATWARAWKNYDIGMTSWKLQDKKSFLKNWCTTSKQNKDSDSDSGSDDDEGFEDLETGEVFAKTFEEDLAGRAG